MPKYLLLKHYRGGPEPHHPFPPMDEWAPEDVEAHMAFLRQVGDDALGGSLGDSNALGDVTESRVRVVVEAEEDLGVVREEPPGLAFVSRA